MSSAAVKIQDLASQPIFAGTATGRVERKDPVLGAERNRQGLHSRECVRVAGHVEPHFVFLIRLGLERLADPAAAQQANAAQSLSGLPPAADVRNVAADDGPAVNGRASRRKNHHFAGIRSALEAAIDEVCLGNGLPSRRSSPMKSAPHPTNDWENPFLPPRTGATRPRRRRRNNGVCHTFEAVAAARARRFLMRVRLKPVGRTRRYSSVQCRQNVSWPLNCSRRPSARPPVKNPPIGCSHDAP